jgi:HSP20 family molecular chaperone IbpA
MDELQAEMARFWGRPLAMWPVMRPLRRLAQTPLAMPSTPRVDGIEKDGILVLNTELPGVRKEDVQVELEDGDLVIRGQAKAETEVKEERFYRMERGAGGSYRRLSLTFEVPPDQIQASMADGMLEVRIPRPAEQTAQATRPSRRHT